jgi:hypothetical protein
MKKNINPELKKNDRIILIHMNGETMGSGIKGKVLKKVSLPYNSDMYDVEWYEDDYESKVISNLSLIVGVDSWIFDMDQKQIQERNFKDLDEIISFSTFLKLMSKSDRNKIIELFNLERDLSTHNMFTEGGKFLACGPEYIKDYIKLISYDNDFTEDRNDIIDEIISKSQETKDILIRSAIKSLEDNKEEITISKVQTRILNIIRVFKSYLFDGKL